MSKNIRYSLWGLVLFVAIVLYERDNAVDEYSLRLLQVITMDYPDIYLDVMEATKVAKQSEHDQRLWKLLVKAAGFGM